MNSLNGPFANLVSEMAKATPVPKALSVAVLGPSVADGDDNPGGQKRIQIRDALTADGHRPFFPEERAASDSASPLLLSQEVILLDGPDVDLVIILYTDTSTGALQKISHFLAYPSLTAKTAVLYPAKFYQPGVNLFSDTVRGYLVRMPYSDCQFKACHLVHECRNWAYTMAIGRWIPFEFHRF